MMYFEDILKISTPYIESDPVKADWKMGGFGNRFLPINVFISKYDLNLYFYHYSKLGEWLLDYVIASKDKELKGLSFYEMYSDEWLDTLNENDAKERLKPDYPEFMKDSMPTGEWIRNYSEKRLLGNKPFFFKEIARPSYYLTFGGTMIR